MWVEVGRGELPSPGVARRDYDSEAPDGERAVAQSESATGSTRRAKLVDNLACFEHDSDTKVHR